MSADYRLFLNDDKTVLLHIWSTGEVTIATRGHQSWPWGPPVTLKEDKTE